MASTGDEPAGADDGDRHRRALLRQERSRQTRESIVRSAAGLFAERGFHDTSVAEICAVAGVARTTYYFHFENKQELLRELTWLTAQGVERRLREVLESPATLDDHLEVFIHEIARRVTAMPRELAVEVLVGAMPGVAYLGRFPDGRVDFGRMLADVFARAVDRGELPAGVDTEELGAILGGMVMEGLVRWATDHTPDAELEDVLRRRVTLVMTGLGRPPVTPRQSSSSSSHELP